MKIFILIIFSVIYFADCKFFDLNKDKITVDVRYFRNCQENNENFFNLHLLTKKLNRTHTGFNMNINITEPIDRTFELESELRIWGDGGWKKNFFSDRRQDACNTGRLLLGPLFKSMLEKAKINPNCPIDPGYYLFDNVVFDFTHVPIVIQDGRFYLIASLIKQNRHYICVEGEFDVKKIVS